MISPVIKQLILIRHARTDYDRSCVPPENPPLDIKTDHDYAAMGADLPDRYRWIISPLIRCQQTADQLVSITGQHILANMMMTGYANNPMASGMARISKHCGTRNYHKGRNITGISFIQTAFPLMGKVSLKS